MLNVIHPLVPEQIEAFLTDKDDVLIVEEGNPAFIEQNVRLALSMADRGYVLETGRLAVSGDSEQ